MAGTDKYAQMLYAEVVESAANTLTFEPIEFGLSLFDKVGILMHRLEWSFNPALLADDTDTIEWGLAVSNSIDPLTPSQASVIVYNRRYVREIGTAATAVIYDNPIVNDFSSLPGGGILITPKPLYIAVEGTNLGSAATVNLRMWFTIVTLKPEEYFELLETRHFFG